MMHTRIKLKCFLLVVTSVWICTLNARSTRGLSQEKSIPALETGNRGTNKNMMKNEEVRKTTTKSNRQLMASVELNSQKIVSVPDSFLNIDPDSQKFTRSQLLQDLKACVLAQPSDLISIDDTIRLLSYLKKIKTKIKLYSVVDILERNLQMSFQHMKSKRSNVVKHFQFLALVFFLRLYTILKFCNGSARFKSNQNQNLLPVKSCLCCSADTQTNFYFEKMVGVYRHSLRKLFHVSKCKRKRPEKRSTTDDSEESFRDTLISNFMANSLPDLAIPDEQQKTLLASYSQPLIVDDQSATHKPIIHISTTTQVADWSIHSSTDLYPVPLITVNPQTSPDPYPSWRPATSNPSDHWNNHASNWYPVNNYPNQPVGDDLFLQFPAPDSYQEPFFVEPIVVSSVDQLPTNYPIPMENASLSHNPLTVMVGNGPPEIVVLQDMSFQSVVEVDPQVPPPAGASAAGQPVAVQQDTAADPAAPASAGSAGSAVGPLAAAAAAAAGLGALGAAGLGTGIIGGAVAGGIGAGSAAAISAGASGGVAGDITADGSADSGVAVAATDVLAYSPASEDELETVYGEFYDMLEWITSFGFVRTILTAMYSLVFPHVSLLVTSGFTVVAFFFPWLYPHIVVPVMSFLSSISS